MDEQPDKKPEKTPDKPKVRRTGQRRTIAPNKHLIRVFLGRDTAGKRHYYTETFHGGARQADERIREVIRRHKAGEALKVNADSFSTFINQWLDSKRHSVAETSFKVYGQLVELYIRKDLGHLLLAQVTADEIQRLYNKLREKDKLSVVSIRQVHRVLGMIFKLAVVRKKLVGSPMVGVQLPKDSDSDEGQAKAMSVEQILRFLEASKGSRFERLFHVAFHVGCRPTELLALKWGDLNQQAKTLRIDENLIWRKAGDWYLKKVKTAKSRRTIAVTDDVMELLAEHRRLQLETRMRRGKLWTDYDFIFATDTGAPWEQWKLREDFKDVLARAGLPSNFTPYSARHSVASLLIEAGVNIKAVSERLGHSRTGITMDVYAHVSEGMQREVSEEMGRLLKGYK